MRTEEAVARLQEWAEALEGGEVLLALECHDEVTAHIKENQDGQVLFQLAKMEPQSFISWASLKSTIREQLAKGPEQMSADYFEAVMQLDDFVQKLGMAKSAREVMKLVSGIQESLQPCLLNASFLDREPEPEVKPEPIPEPEPKAPKKKPAAKKAAKKSAKKEKVSPTVDNSDPE